MNEQKLDIILTESAKDMCHMLTQDGKGIGFAWSKTVDNFCNVRDLAQLGKRIFKQIHEIELIMKCVKNLCFRQNLLSTQFAISSHTSALSLKIRRIIE